MLSHYNCKQPIRISEKIQHSFSQQRLKLGLPKTKYNIPRTHAKGPKIFKVIRIKVKVAPLDHVENHIMRHNSKSINARDIK